MIDNSQSIFIKHDHRLGSSSVSLSLISPQFSSSLWYEVQSFCSLYSSKNIIYCQQKYTKYT